MGRTLILETTFIIDLERERRRQSPGPASSFLERNPEDELVITETIVGEMACSQDRTTCGSPPQH